MKRGVLMLLLAVGAAALSKRREQRRRDTEMLPPSTVLRGNESTLPLVKPTPWWRRIGR